MISSLRMMIGGFATALFLTASPASADIDWNKVAGKDVTLFYPAQFSWEMLLTQKEHSGADKFREGKNCRECHEGEEAASGNLLVADKSVDSSPIPNKPGFIKATIKAAHDAENLFVHVDFQPGTQPDAGMEPNFVHKVALMFDGGGVAEMARGGCFSACHDNLSRMPSGNDTDTTKYLTRSRAKMARNGGNDIKPAEELAQMRAADGYLEYWQARFAPDQTVTSADGFILEKRQESVAPKVTAAGTVQNGVWSVTFSRKLSAGAPYKDIVPGKTYTFGFSVHAGHTAKRFHYVSLEKTLVLDQGKADLLALKQ